MPQLNELVNRLFDPKLTKKISILMAEDSCRPSEIKYVETEEKLTEKITQYQEKIRNNSKHSVNAPYTFVFEDDECFLIAHCVAAEVQQYIMGPVDDAWKLENSHVIALDQYLDLTGFGEKEDVEKFEKIKSAVYQDRTGRQVDKLLDTVFEDHKTHHPEFNINDDCYDHADNGKFEPHQDKYNLLHMLINKRYGYEDSEVAPRILKYCLDKFPELDFNKPFPHTGHPPLYRALLDSTLALRILLSAPAGRLTINAPFLDETDFPGWRPMHLLILKCRRAFGNSYYEALNLLLQHENLELNHPFPPSKKPQDNYLCGLLPGHALLYPREYDRGMRLWGHEPEISMADMIDYFTLMQKHSTFDINKAIYVPAFNANLSLLHMAILCKGRYQHRTGYGNDFAALIEPLLDLGSDQSIVAYETGHFTPISLVKALQLELQITCFETYNREHCTPLIRWGYDGILNSYQRIFQTCVRGLKESLDLNRQAIDAFLDQQLASLFDIPSHELFQKLDSLQYFALVEDRSGSDIGLDLENSDPFVFLPMRIRAMFEQLVMLSAGQIDERMLPIRRIDAIQKLEAELLNSIRTYLLFKEVHEALTDHQVQISFPGLIPGLIGRIRNEEPMPNDNTKFCIIITKEDKGDSEREPLWNYQLTMGKDVSEEIPFSPEICKEMNDSLKKNIHCSALEQTEQLKEIISQDKNFKDFIDRNQYQWKQLLTKAELLARRHAKLIGELLPNEELTIAVGYVCEDKGHLIYLNFTCFYGVADDIRYILVRADNLGDGIIEGNHPVESSSDSEMVKPKIIAIESQQIFSQARQDFIDYLKTCFINFWNQIPREKCIEHIYNASSSEVINDFPASKMQQSGSCVVQGHNVGLAIRLSVASLRLEDRSLLYHWYMEQERNFITRKRKIIKEGTQQSQRERLASQMFPITMYLRFSGSPGFFSGLPDTGVGGSSERSEAERMALIERNKERSTSEEEPPSKRTKLVPTP